MTLTQYTLTAMAAVGDPSCFAPVDELVDALDPGAVPGRDLPVPRAMSHCRAVRTYYLSGSVTIEDLRASLATLSQRESIDLVLQPLAARQRQYRLAVFDMDSTLIRCEVIDELARCAGVGDQVALITERAMKGEIDFEASFRERLALLEGLDASCIDALAAGLPVTEGVRELMLTLRARGVYTAVISGGFLPFAEYLQRQFGFDEVYANALPVEQGRVIGKPLLPIVDGDFKRRTLLDIAARLSVRPEEVIAVGDGANDIPMMTAAGLGIAYAAKPRVAERADCQIRYVGLDGVLYLLGSKGELDDG